MPRRSRIAPKRPRVKPWPVDLYLQLVEIDRLFKRIINNINTAKYDGLYTDPIHVSVVRDNAAKVFMKFAELEKQFNIMFEIWEKKIRPSRRGSRFPKWVELMDIIQLEMLEDAKQIMARGYEYYFRKRMYDSAIVDFDLVIDICEQCWNMIKELDFEEPILFKELQEAIRQKLAQAQKSITRPDAQKGQDKEP